MRLRRSVAAAAVAAVGAFTPSAAAPATGVYFEPRVTCDGGECTLAVENTGTVTLVSVIVAEVPPSHAVTAISSAGATACSNRKTQASCSWYAGEQQEGTFLPGQTKTVEFTLAPADVSGVLVAVCAAAGSATRFDTTCIHRLALGRTGNDVSVTAKAQSAHAKAGAPVVFDVTVANAGPDEARRATLLLETDVAWTSVRPSTGSCATRGKVATCNLGTLAAKAVVKVVASTVADASVDGVGLEAEARRPAGDRDPRNNTARANANVRGRADAWVVVSATSRKRTARWEFRVGNDGPDPTDVELSVSDVLAPGHRFASVSAPRKCSLAPRAACTFSDLRPGSKAEVVFTGELPEGASGAFRVSGRVTVNAGDRDPGKGNNSDRTTLELG